MYTVPTKFYIEGSATVQAATKTKYNGHLQGLRWRQDRGKYVTTVLK